MSDDRWELYDARKWSWVAIYTRLLMDRLIDPHAYMAYGVLAMHANRGGTTYVSLPRVAELMGCSQTRARQALRQLIDAGYVFRAERPGKQPLWTLVDEIDLPGPPAAQPPPTPTGSGGVADAEPAGVARWLKSREEASEQALARDFSDEPNRATPSDPEGVHPQPPQIPEGASSTTPTDSVGDPLKSCGGTRANQPEPLAEFSAETHGDGPSTGPTPNRAATESRDLPAASRDLAGWLRNRAASAQESGFSPSYIRSHLLSSLAQLPAHELAAGGAGQSTEREQLVDAVLVDLGTGPSPGP